MEALCRSEDELKFQLSSIQDRRRELDQSLKLQETGKKEDVYSHFDKKFARQEILKQIAALQNALSELDAGTDRGAARIETREQSIAELKQAMNELAAQEEQYNRALLDVQFAIRRALNQESSNHE